MVIAKYSLTKREAEVMMMLAENSTSSEIESTLFLSKSTVNTHRYHIYKKLEVGSQKELVNKIKEFEVNFYEG